MSTDVLDQLTQVLEARKKASADKSYIASLHQKGLNNILEKVGEESIETILAARDAELSGNTEKLIYETADLWFHSLVMLSHLGENAQAVLDELERLGKKGFSDSLLLVHRSYADLRYLDGSLDPSDRELGKCYVGDSRQGNYSALGIAKVTGLRSWLSQWSLRESQLLAEPHLQKITVPSMVIQGTRDVGIFPGDAHRLHDALASEDKTLVFNGADHFCMRPGSREEIADCMAAWLQERGI